MQQRYYDPATLRFISTDPVSADPLNFNRYWYANNNPYTYVDPDGRQAGCGTMVQGGATSHCSSFGRSAADFVEGKMNSYPTDRPLTYSETRSLVAEHNRSGQDDEVVIAVAWKESSFDPNAKAKTSSATGLMMMTKAAAKDVGADHSKMKDPIANMRAGTEYLKLRIRWVGGDLSKGLDGYGTGPGYSENILEAARMLKEIRSDPTADPLKILKEQIHP
jgi:soluble lytic murein transglycosylase-like protein